MSSSAKCLTYVEDTVAQPLEGRDCSAGRSRKFPVGSQNIAKANSPLRCLLTCIRIFRSREGGVEFRIIHLAC